LAREDLIPFTERSEDEVKELNRLGGINSGAVRRKKAAAKEWALFALGMKRKVSEKTLEQLKEMGVEPEEITTHALAMVKIADMAIAGNLKAYEILRDTSGQKPTDSVSLAHSFMGDFEIVMGDED
jgi:phage terminase large subunit